jgi:molybdate transport system permease protein
MQGYQELITNPELWRALWLTARLAFSTTLVLLILGVPLALLLNSQRLPFTGLFEALVSLPIVLPPTVIGFYLLILLSPDSGIGSIWVKITGQTLTFSFMGLLIGSVLYSLPYAVQPFQSGLKTVPHDVLEAASLEARPFEVFLHVHLPLARRGILVGSTLSFAHTIGEFGVVLMLGGNIPGKTRVASIALYDEVQKLNYPVAHSYAIVLLLISFMLLSTVAYLNKRATIFDQP